MVFFKEYRCWYTMQVIQSTAGTLMPDYMLGESSGTRRLARSHYYPILPFPTRLLTDK
jgi:hypothetical protein